MHDHQHLLVEAEGQLLGAGHGSGCTPPGPGAGPGARFPPGPTLCLRKPSHIAWKALLCSCGGGVWAARTAHQAPPCPPQRTPASCRWQVGAPRAQTPGTPRREETPCLPRARSGPALRPPPLSKDTDASGSAASSPPGVLSQPRKEVAGPPPSPLSLYKLPVLRGGDTQDRTRSGGGGGHCSSNRSHLEMGDLPLVRQLCKEAGREVMAGGAAGVQGPGARPPARDAHLCASHRN